MNYQVDEEMIEEIKKNEGKGSISSIVYFVIFIVIFGLPLYSSIEGNTGEFQIISLIIVLFLAFIVIKKIKTLKEVSNDEINIEYVATIIDKNVDEMRGFQEDAGSRSAVKYQLKLCMEDGKEKTINVTPFEFDRVQIHQKVAVFNFGSPYQLKAMKDMHVVPVKEEKVEKI